MYLKEAADEYLFECKCRKLSKRTVDNYSKHIGYLLNYLENEKDVTKLEDLKPQYIKQYIIEKQKAGNKPNYINDLIKVYKTLFKYLYDEGYTETLITEKIKNVKKEKVIIRTFTNDNIKDMISYYKGNDFLSIRNKTILIILFDTGIRLSELLNLKEKDIKDDYIVIVNGKGGKDRVVPKSPFISKWLFKYMIVRKEKFIDRNLDDKELFLSKNCKRLSSEMVERIIKDAGKYANVSKDVRVSPHTCRHTYAQMQLMNGLDIYSLSRILGHESISVTQTYLNGIRDERVLMQGNKTSPLMHL